MKKVSVTISVTVSLNEYQFEIYLTEEGIEHIKDCINGLHGFEDCEIEDVRGMYQEEEEEGDC